MGNVIELRKSKRAYVEEIEKYIIDTGTVTFAEIERQWPDLFGGGVSVSFPAFQENNIYLWFDFTEQGADVLEQIRQRGKIKSLPTDRFVYLLDGRVPDVPVATSMRKYKTPRWLPVCFSRSNRGDAL